MQIQISWLLQKPGSNCLQRQGISGFSRTRVNHEIISAVILPSCWFKKDSCWLLAKVCTYWLTTVLSLLRKNMRRLSYWLNMILAVQNSTQLKESRAIFGVTQKSVRHVFMEMQRKCLPRVLPYRNQHFLLSVWNSVLIRDKIANCSDRIWPTCYYYTCNLAYKVQSRYFIIFRLQPMYFYLLYKNLCCGYSFELPWHVNNISFYK